MMKTNLRWLKNQGFGQGLVEFALIIPLFLMVTIGVIEAGRMLFTYTTVFAASREAARYASGTGLSAYGIPYYLDCTGIAAEANRIGSLAGAKVVCSPLFTDVTYDHGPSTGSDFQPQTANEVTLGDRVKVTVNATYKPLFGFIPAIKTIPISSTTVRTILKEVSIYGSSPGGSGIPLSVSITSPIANSHFSEGASITFTAVASYGTAPYTNWKWFSDKDGLFGNSESFHYNGLSIGRHVITAQVSDSASPPATAITQIIITIHGKPNVTIISPIDGGIYEDDSPILFKGTAIDQEDGDISGQLVWTLSDGTPLENGASFTRSLQPGAYTIIATATNSNNLTDSDSVTILVRSNLPPKVKITTPADGSSFPDGTNIIFHATAWDAEDGDCSATLVWTEGGVQIGTGPTISLDTLTVGTHTISATAYDLDNHPGSDNITIQITFGKAPSVNILTPISGTIFYINDQILVTGEAWDAEDGNLNAFIQWSFDGTPFGSGPSATYTGLLTPGVHVIRARVDDSAGNRAMDTVSIEISSNAPPEITIVVPESDGHIYIERSPVNFRAIVTDDQDENLEETTEWSTNLPSPSSIGSGAAITVTNLVVGTHTITARVVDSGGLEGIDSRTVIIRPDPCSIQMSPARIDKKEVIWNFTNNSTYTYTLIRSTIPWRKHSSTQALTKVSFGVEGSEYTLWSGNDTSAGSTFGPSGDPGIEFPWTPTDPNFTFNAGPGMNERLVFRFKLNVANFSGTMIVVFKNNQTLDLCTYSYAMY